MNVTKQYPAAIWTLSFLDPKSASASAIRLFNKSCIPIRARCQSDSESDFVLSVPAAAAAPVAVDVDPLLSFT